MGLARSTDKALHRTAHTSLCPTVVAEKPRFDTPPKAFVKHVHIGRRLLARNGRENHACRTRQLASAGAAVPAVGVGRHALVRRVSGISFRRKSAAGAAEHASLQNGGEDGMSNPRDPFEVYSLRGERLRPLGHLSAHPQMAGFRCSVKNRFCADFTSIRDGPKPGNEHAATRHVRVPGATRRMWRVADVAAVPFRRPRWRIPRTHSAPRCHGIAGAQGRPARSGAPSDRGRAWRLGFGMSAPLVSCEVCSAGFTPGRPDQRCCSPACRARAQEAASEAYGVGAGPIPREKTYAPLSAVSLRPLDVRNGPTRPQLSRSRASDPAIRSASTSAPAQTVCPSSSMPTANRSSEAGERASSATSSWPACGWW